MVEWKKPFFMLLLVKKVNVFHARLQEMKHTSACHEAESAQT